MWQNGVSVSECFGLSPWRQRLAELRLTFRGDPSTPKSRFDRTSLGLLRPRLSLPLWLGLRPAGRLSPVYNLFNHAQPDPELGWSVMKRTVRDFRGGTLSYDSHNGTDFAVPPGTPVVAAAPGTVLRVSNEFNRGGLKVFVDHGLGLFTSYNHLSRASVRPGDRLGRAQPLGLSGASGLDGFLLFPWSTPHVHFNVWLGGAYVDPFARDGEVSLWRGGENRPLPHRDGEVNEAMPPTDWDHDAVDELLRHCRHPGAVADITSAEAPDQRAMNAHFHLVYFPSRFERRLPLLRTTMSRAQVLDLPLPADEYDGALLPAQGSPSISSK